MKIHRHLSSISASRKAALVLAGSIATLLGAREAQATLLYWDVNGTAANTAVSAGGAWNGINAFWNTVANGSGGVVQAGTTAGDDLVFSSGAVYTTGIITASNARVASSVTFEDNVALTLAGPVTIGGTGTKSGVFVLLGDNAANTVSAALTLAAASTIQNAGTGLMSLTGGVTGSFNLTLQNNNTTANGVTVSTTAVNNTGSVTNSGTGTGATLISTNIGANVTDLIQNSATSALILTSTTANAFAGNTSVLAGTLNVNAGGAVGLLGTGALTLGAGVGSNAAALTFGSAQTTTEAVSGITVAAGTTGLLSINNTSANSRTITNGITINNTTNATATNLAGVTFSSTAGGSITIGGVVSGLGGVTVNNTGAGVTILSGANSYSGGSNILAGTLRGATATSFGTASINLGATAGTAAATLQASGSVAITNPITVRSGSSGVKLIQSSGNVNPNFSGTITFNDNLSLQNTGIGGSMQISGTSDLNGKVLTVSSISSGTLLINGLLSGTGSIVATGAGTGSIAFGQQHTYSGGTTVSNTGSAVVPQVSSIGTTSGPLGTGVITFNGGLIRASTGADVTLTNALSFAGNVTVPTIAAEKSLILTGAGTLTGDRTITSNAGATVVGASMILGGSIGDGGIGFGITKAGTGNLALTGANTYGGNTVINAGVLSIGSTNSLPGYNSTGRFFVAAGATLGVYNAVSDADVSTLLGTSNFATGATLGFDTVSGDRVFSQNIGDTAQGTLNVAKLGNNTLRLSGVNTYTGVTNINTGVLSLATTSALPGWDTNGRYSVASGATLAVSNAVSEAEVATLIATTNFVAGSSVGFDTATGDRTFVGSLANTTQGALGLTKVGANTLTLSGANNYTGTTSVINGTLNVTGTITGNTTSSTLALGTTAANTVVNVGNDMTLFAVTGANIVGSATAYNQTAGTVNTYAAGVGAGGSYVANIGYGYFNLTGGVFKSNGSFSIGTNNALSNGVAYVGGTGVLDWSGSGNQTVGYASAASLTVGPGGSVSRGGSANITWLATNSGSSAILNVAGGNLDLGAAGNVFVNNTPSGGTSVTFNLAGGTLTMGKALSTNGSNSGTLYANYAGGTLKAAANVANPLSVLTSVSTIFGAIDNAVAVGNTSQNFTGGLTVDTNGFTITYGNALQGATGNGVRQANMSVTGGSGYIGAPLVQFTGGTLAANGTPASGYAVISGGAVTGIVITSPGTYTSDPTITLTGGGGTGAGVALSSLTGNSTDLGLTKTGIGTLALTAVNTYAGATSVTNGTLALSGSGSISATSSLSVGANARFVYLPSFPATLSLASGASLNLSSGSTIGGTFGSTIATDGVASVSGTVNLVPSGTFTSGDTYTLLTAATGLNGATYNVLNPVDYTFTTTVSADSVAVTPTAATPLTSAYWIGGLAGIRSVRLWSEAVTQASSVSLIKQVAH